MADPRFYDNRGPFTLAEICAKAGVALPDDVDSSARVFDLATLEGAGPQHIAFCAGRAAVAQLNATKAGFCFIGKDAGAAVAPPGTVALPCDSAQHAFAATLNLFYPENMLVAWSQQTPVDPSAKITANVMLAPGVVIGPHAEIGEGTRIGPNSVIGRGVTIGRDCEIGSNVTIASACIGDRVTILPGAQIGQPGFGFASSAAGHVKIPQIGRVIVQDKVEIGACATIDRGAIGDTVIGEGTKIDNLVQIGHNSHIGRHCIIVAQVGISGSCEIGDFVVMGGQVGIADHALIESGTRLAARTGVMPGLLKRGDYGGAPARPVKDWLREGLVLAKLAKTKK
ncbi:MAG TPA: UDP-3-O-(3-hydroxymyristoyl)glucosamine N-acyltransferase [Rhizomicrobium sp.]|nr:UDP-3-O-(3-hydroxymyristoyl)glucosamine N-acyltransferase [Rhizomicrobium sp.]